MAGLTENASPVTWSPPARPAKVSIDAQIGEVMRELALRKNCYPRFVVEGRIDPGTAERRIACLEGTLVNLRALRAFETEKRK
jgi:hypothetical protein